MIKPGYIVFLFIILISSSCAVLKKTNKHENENEKNELRYIYLFDNACKNRLDGDLQKALEQYTAAIEINPESAASYFYTASIFITKKEYETALSYSKKAVELQSQNFWYNLEKADLLMLNGKQEDAVKLYEKLLQKNKHNELLYRKLINIYEKNKKLNKLISIYEQQQKNIDFSEEAAIKLVNLYIRTENYKKAENQINYLINKYPDKLQYQGMAAEFYYSLNQITKAEKIYKTLLQKYPENTDINLSYAIFCKKTNQHEEFFKTTKKLMNSDLEFIKKTGLLNSGQYPNFPKTEYLILLQDLYKHNPDEILSNTLFAEYYLNIDNKKEALPYIKKTLELNPSDFNMALMLFSLRYDVKDFKNLLTETNHYLSFFPNQPKIYLYKGIAEFKLDKNKESISSLLNGKNLTIDDSRLKDQFNYYLSLNYKTLKQFNKALKFVDEIVKNNNTDVKINELYGDLFFAENNKKEALKYWNRAKEHGNTTEKLLNKIKNINNLTIDEVLNN